MKTFNFVLSLICVVFLTPVLPVFSDGPGLTRGHSSTNLSQKKPSRLQAAGAAIMHPMRTFNAHRDAKKKEAERNAAIEAAKEESRQNLERQDSLVRRRDAAARQNYRERSQARKKEAQEGRAGTRWQSNPLPNTPQQSQRAQEIRRLNRDIDHRSTENYKLREVIKNLEQGN